MHYFELFFETLDIMGPMLELTSANMRRDTKGVGPKSIDAEEFSNIIGLLLKMMLIGMPVRRDYWRIDPTPDNLWPPFKFGEVYGIRRNRFDYVMRCWQWCRCNEVIYFTCLSC